jgi:hypothetical protein
MKSAITYAIACAAIMASASAANAQGCGEGDIQLCGFVWNDANGDGIQNDDPDQDPNNGDQSGIDGLKVTLFVWDTTNNQWDPDPVTETVTSGGFYDFSNPPDGFNGLYKVVVAAPPGTEPSCLPSDPSCPSSTFGDDTLDNDGVNDAGGAKAEVALGSAGVRSREFDFGFHSTGTLSPGTGTPGYWKNHPQAWSASKAVVGGRITIGGRQYTVAEAIGYMGKVSKDKTITIFNSLLSAKLNVGIGNESGCIDARIAEADAWMSIHPVGSGVPASSEAWQDISPAHKDLDDYNNGRLCAPHRN